MMMEHTQEKMTPISTLAHTHANKTECTNTFPALQLECHLELPLEMS